jgi:hypothetical protein
MTRIDNATVDHASVLTAAILQHPNFDRATHHFCKNAIEWRREIGFINNLLSNYSRNIIVYYICALHFANDTGLPEGGATFSRLWEMVDIRKDCGSRALRTILGVLTLVGYLRKRRGELDLRTFAYEPTEKLLSHLRKHMANMMGCMDILLHTEKYSEQAKNDPTLLEHFVKTGGQAFLRGEINLFDAQPKLIKILHMAGGAQTIYAISRAEILKTKFPLPAEIAKNYKTTVRQVKSVVDYCMAEGLILRDENNNFISAEGAANLIKFSFARELAFNVKYGLGLENEIMEQVKG